MERIAVLGGGRIGSLIARDLSSDSRVFIFDKERIDSSSLPKSTQYRQIDFTNSAALRDALKDFELAISAVPGSIGHQVLEHCLKAGIHTVDISFFDHNPLLLDDVARGNNAIAVIDAGIAPGLSNMVAGYYDKQFNLTHFKCMVGGLPFIRQWPFEYKAPFSPADVIEEYIRPARIKVEGEIHTLPPLSEPELIEIPGVGSLEAFNTDGLRTLLHTLQIPNMREKTLRYPGHREYIEVLRDAGFFSKNPVEIEGSEIRPIDLTSSLLFSQWHLQPKEKEFTVMRIEMNSEERMVAFDLWDEFNEQTGITSMSRTTGFTCTSIARLLIDRKLTEPGIITPEELGKDEKYYHFVIDRLRSRGIDITSKIYPEDEEL